MLLEKYKISYFKQESTCFYYTMSKELLRHVLEDFERKSYEIGTLKEILIKKLNMLYKNQKNIFVIITIIYLG